MAQAKKTAAKKKNNDTALAAGIGAGVLAAGAAAAAGYYFYGTKDAKKHRAAASKWAKGMKTQVEKELKKVQKFDKKVVAAIVDKAAAAYEGVRGVDMQDLKAAANELKKNWEALQKDMAKTVKKAAPKKTVKKAVKKAAPKKAAKKTGKK